MHAHDKNNNREGRQGTNVRGRNQANPVLDLCQAVKILQDLHPGRRARQAKTTHTRL